MSERKAFAPACLPSSGLNERRATIHVYDHSEKVTLNFAGRDPVTGVAHFYRCTETGSMRRWGFDRLTGEKLEDAASN